ncbi:neuropeptide Y receptor type 6-like [Glandiceps talaboti]
MMNDLDKLFLPNASSWPDYESSGTADGEIVLLVTMCLLIFILSILGNLGVIIVSKKSRQLSSDLKVYLTSLAAADICMAVFCLPFQLPAMVVNRWLFGDVMCPLVKYAQQVSIMASIYTLVAVSIDRYRAVINPLQQRTSSPNKGFIPCIIWAASLA